MEDEATALVREIIKLIEESGCEVTRKDIRIKDAGPSWFADIRLGVRPIHSEEVG